MDQYGDQSWTPMESIRGLILLLHRVYALPTKYTMSMAIVHKKSTDGVAPPFGRATALQVFYRFH